MSTTEVQSRGFEYGVKHFAANESGLLSKILVNSVKISLDQALFLITLGSVYVDQHRKTTDVSILENQLIRVHTKPRRFLTNYNWNERIVYEDQDFVVINKPHSIPSHPSVDNILENSLTATSQFLNKPLFITHRLDSLTEGLIVYSKSQIFTSHFNDLMTKKQIDKKYVALIPGDEPIPGILIHYMQPSPRAPKRLSNHQIDNWAYCEIKIIDQKKINQNLWLKIDLITGRTHQIRSQLSHLGRPIIGDELYGSNEKRFNEFNQPSIALKAQELQFTWAGKIHHFKLNEDLTSPF